MKTLKSTVLVAFLAFSGQALMAQTQNPDAQPIRQDGPIRVLNAPPQQQPQNDPNRPQTIMDKIRLGGSFGLSVGNITNIEVSPIVALQLTPKLTVGTGIIYQYYSFRSPFANVASFKDNIFGGRIFGMYNIFDGFNAHVEYETMNRKYYDYIDNKYKPTWITGFLVGGTYSQPTGGRLIRAVNLSVLYNLSYNSQINPTNGANISPYNNPLVIRASFF